jgi:tRNA acetyltransferase TAN1
MGKKQNHTKLISPVRLDLQCVLFFKIRPPIDPVAFVHRICKEVVSTSGIRRMRYINRLTPMTLMGKATEKGLGEVGKIVLGQHFNLREDQEKVVEDEVKEGRKVESREFPNYSVSRRAFTFCSSLRLPRASQNIEMRNSLRLRTDVYHSTQFGPLLVTTQPP